MTPEQMRERSSAKMKQVLELMRVLHVRVEARQRVDEHGFIELMPFWIDDEKYQAAEVPLRTLSDVIETPNEIVRQPSTTSGTPGIPTFAPNTPKDEGTA